MGLFHHQNGRQLDRMVLSAMPLECFQEQPSSTLLLSVIAPHSLNDAATCGILNGSAAVCIL